MEDGRWTAAGRLLVLVLALVGLLLAAGGGAVEAAGSGCRYVISAEARLLAMGELQAWLAVLQDGSVTEQRVHLERAVDALDALDTAPAVGCGAGMVW